MSRAKIRVLRAEDRKDEDLATVFIHLEPTEETCCLCGNKADLGFDDRHYLCFDCIVKAIRRLVVT